MPKFEVTAFARLPLTVSVEAPTAEEAARLVATGEAEVFGENGFLWELHPKFYRYLSDADVKPLRVYHYPERRSLRARAASWTVVDLDPIPQLQREDSHKKE